MRGGQKGRKREPVKKLLTGSIFRAMGNGCEINF